MRVGMTIHHREWAVKITCTVGDQAAKRSVRAGASAGQLEEKSS
jgi:hypothetical protein